MSHHKNTPTATSNVTAAQTDYAVAPGEYLAEWMQASDLAIHQLATMLSESPSWLRQIITGSREITADVAIRLEQITQIPAKTWLRHEQRFQDDLVRLGLAMRRGDIPH